MLTQADAQEMADQLNAVGVDWTYADDMPDDHRPKFRFSPTSPPKK